MFILLVSQSCMLAGTGISQPMLRSALLPLGLRADEYVEGPRYRTV